MPLPGQVEENEPTQQASGPQAFSIANALAGIEVRLDRISGQVDTCIAEVMQASLKTPFSRRVNFPTKERKPDKPDGGIGTLPVIPSEAPLLLEGMEGACREPTTSRQTFAQGPLTCRESARETRQTLTISEDPHSRSSQDAAGHGADLQGLQSGMAAVHESQGRKVKAFHSVDLKVAWQMYGTELKQRIGTLQTQPLMRLVYRSRADFIWELLDDPESSRTAWWLAAFLKTLVLVSVLTTELASTAAAYVSAAALLGFELSCDAFFFVEFGCRILSTPSKRQYLADPLNLADILSALGLPLRICLICAVAESPEHEVLHVILLYFLPMARFLKLLRRFDTVRLLIEACQNSAESLPVLAYIVALMTLTAATGIYLLEPKENIPSMPHALWLSIVTMTTVGYGDFYPVSLGGYITVSILTFVSLIFLALPVGIIGYEFTESWKKRHQVLLMTRMRRCLLKWGYSAQDMNVLLNYVDGDGDGSLNLTEFVELIRQMRIGLSVDSAVQIFALYHDEPDGQIKYTELLRDVFPEEYLRDQQQKAGGNLQLQASKENIHQALQRFESNRQRSARRPSEMRSRQVAEPTDLAVSKSGRIAAGRE